MLVKICWAVTAIVAAISLLGLAADLGAAESAPQQAAAAAMALAWVVLPYVFTRSMEGLFPPKVDAKPAKSSGQSSDNSNFEQGSF